MAFSIKARVLLELGSELISSDAIALYELVKNAIDAGSKQTLIDVVMVLQYSDYRRLRDMLNGAASLTRAALVGRVEDALEPSAPEALKDAFLTRIRNAPKDQLADALDDAFNEENYIAISDSGHGMNLAELRELYLTLGTPSRLMEKQALFKRLSVSAAAGVRVPLGEKGIGRLAAMRLGERLEVLTSRQGEVRLNILNVDWGALKDAPTLDLANFPAEPKASKEKENPRTNGTRIKISGLKGDWTEHSIQGLARTDFAKLYDPFLQDIERDDIRIRFNGRQVLIPVFDRTKLDAADAVCSASFTADNGVPVLAGEVRYSAKKGKVKTFRHAAEHLYSTLEKKGARPRRRQADREDEESPPVLGVTSLGPFEMKAWWFNRLRIRRNLDNSTEIIDWVNWWGGGLLVYRDGFRVYPYASSDDDWLDLDFLAFRSGGYKLNRSQFVGFVRVSSQHNPQLQDQTNREGFRDCPEKQALVRLCQHVLLSELKSFLDSIDEKAEPLGSDELNQIEQRLEISQKEAIRRIKDIGRRIPEERQTVNQLLDYLRDVTLAWERAKEVAATFESELEKYLHLAGVGLMVEFVAHELVRAARNALEAIERTKKIGLPKSAAAAMETLRAQLNTIEKRLRIIDPVSTPGRQRKEPCDIAQIVEDVLDAHAPQFTRHEINVLGPERGRGHLIVKTVKGQIIQILENLVSNSVYWLGQKRNIRKFDPEIKITIDSKSRELTFRDNGPGIPIERGDEIFNAFFTTKPPGEGRGLGLYIAQKLAEYNGATLRLGGPDKDGNCRAFVLSFDKKA